MRNSGFPAWSRVWIVAQLAVLAAVVSLASTGAGLAEDRPRLVVSGEGSVEVAPDMAVLTLGISEEALDADSAMAEVSRRMEDLFATLRGEGVEARDVQTRSLSLQPVQRNNQQVRFRASNQVVVRLRDINRLGRLLGLVIADGANDLGRWSTGLRFDLADRRPAEEAARIAAIKEARAKAKTLAQAAGVSLGPVREIREGGGGSVRGPEAISLRAATDVPVQTGELTIRVQVQMVFDIEP